MMKMVVWKRGRREGRRVGAYVCRPTPVRAKGSEWRGVREEGAMGCGGMLLLLLSEWRRDGEGEGKGREEVGGGGEEVYRPVRTKTVRAKTCYECQVEPDERLMEGGRWCGRREEEWRGGERRGPI